MTVDPSAMRETTTTSAGGDPRRWRALAVLAFVQFMFVLDLTIVNIALPKIKDDLEFGPAGLAWVVNAYALMAGGLLLFGGRLSDLLGRRRVFLAGVALFAIASLICGLAWQPGMLIAGRFGQGVGEALAAPAGLAIIVLLFTNARERANAIGIWVGLGAVGGTAGVVLSGVINDLASWRWIFLINIPIAAFALIAVPRLVEAGRALLDMRSERPDWLGAVCLTGGMLLLVYGLLAAGQAAGSAQVVLPVGAGLLLLVSFVVVERRVARPLVPLSFFANRTRMTAAATTLLFASAFFAMFFLLTLYMQEVLGWSPLKTGLAYLPYGLLIIAGGALASLLVPRLGVRVLLAAGCGIGAIGLFMLSLISTDGTYFRDVLPGSLLLGFGAGVTFPMLGSASVHQVSEDNAGLASGVQTAMTQAGGALGLAVLVAVAVIYADGQIAAGVSRRAAETAGYGTALRAGAVLMLVAAAVTAFAMQSRVGVRAEPNERSVA